VPGTPSQEPLATIESAVGKDYVVGGALNSLEGGNIWEVHATRRFGKDMGAQVGVVSYSGGTDWEALAVKSFRGKDPKKPWAADIGLGVYSPDSAILGDGFSVSTGGQAFVAASYGVGKNITANLSIWAVNFSWDYNPLAVSGTASWTRSAFGVGYRF
jgi:hypothetical protein